MPKINLFLKSKCGFTLIELMITIAIVAVISAIGFSTYKNAQMLGRDAKRKKDLKTIAVALELYKQQYGKYPCTDFQTSVDVSTTGFWIKDYITPVYLPANYPCTNTNTVLDQNFISSMPKDPLNTGGIAFYDPNGFIYAYRAYECNVDGQWYILVANLENRNDPDRVEKKNPRLCNGTQNVYPTWAPNTYSYAITSDSQ